MEVARTSRAPYSKCSMGFVVVSSKGRVYAGLYEKLTTYNPSLGPMQVVVMVYVATGGGGGGVCGDGRWWHSKRGIWVHGSGTGGARGGSGHMRRRRRGSSWQ